MTDLRRWIDLLVLATVALGLACRRQEASDPAPPPTVPVADSEKSDVSIAPREVESTVEPGQVAAAPEPSWGLMPTSVTIGPAESGVQVLLEGTPGDQAEIAWGAEPAGVVTIDSSGYVRPLASGRAEVWAESAGTRKTSEVVVEGRENRPWDFGADVVPVFTRYGCNTGGCHGKADGQNGFHLSLFGYDPVGDFAAIVRSAGGRRVDRFRPESSLLLRKASGQVAHAGGLRLPVDSDGYRLLADWLRSGAPEQQGESPVDLAAVRVEPPMTPMQTPGARQLRVVARYRDGRERDVSRLATYTSNDDLAASVDDAGLATLQRPGEADLIVRYGSEVVPYRLAAPINPDLDFDFAALPRHNFIDEALYQRLERLKLPPSPPADDPTFLRRVTLDLSGQIPTPDEVRRFVADDDPEKRSKVVETLMDRQEFLLFWRLKLGDMLQISRARLGEGAGAYQGWLTRRLEANTPWDAMVRELLTALGDPLDPIEGGPVNYALDGGGDPKIQAELAAQRFLGQRVRCAQCHDHPFDSWTQDDYYGLAAIFAKVRRGGGPDASMMARPLVAIDPDGAIENPRTKRPAAPRLLDGTTIELSEGDDPRVAFADWATAPDNPYFAKAMANWTWAQFFGKGIVDPPDDLSAANPPVHPELLDALAEHFAASGFDLQELIRAIASSAAYAADSRPVPENAGDRRMFSHALPRPLTAHQMVDAISRATNVPERFADLGRQGRRKAIEVFDPGTPSEILDTFGRCARLDGCSPVAAPTLSLAQSLLLIGGDSVDDKVMDLNGYLANLLALEPPPSPAEVVEFLYYRTLCRPPTTEERKHWSGLLSEAGPVGLREAAEDLFWALLNSREFAFNH